MQNFIHIHYVRRKLFDIQCRCPSETGRQPVRERSAIKNQKKKNPSTDQFSAKGV